MDWVACAQTYHGERKEIKDIFITGFRIYDLSLASRQMKLVDRTRECGCSGLPQGECLAKGVSSAFQRTVLDFLDSNRYPSPLKLMPTHGV